MTCAGWAWSLWSPTEGASTVELLLGDDAPDLAVVDWDLPGCGGPELCRQVRAQRRSAPPYIILLAQTEEQVGRGVRRRRRRLRPRRRRRARVAGADLRRAPSRLHRVAAVPPVRHRLSRVPLRSCAVSSASTPATATSPASPTSASTPCSIAARRAPASPSPTTVRSRPSGTWASSRRCSTRRRSPVSRAGGHRSRALLDHRRRELAERAAARALRRRCPHRRRAQRQPGERRRAARRAGRGDGAAFRGTTDTEVVAALHRRRGRRAARDAAVRRAAERIRGAFSIAVLTPQAMYAVRDPHGIRPLALGDLDGSPVVASESCAFDIIGARFVRELEPGEILIARPRTAYAANASSSPGRGPRSTSSSSSTSRAPTPGSTAGRSPTARVEMGRRLAREAPAAADLVIPVPESGVPAAIGYAAAERHPVRRGPHQEPLRVPHLHPAGPAPSRARHPHEAEPRALDDRGQAPRGRGRLDRPRQHDPRHRRDAHRGGGERGAPADQLAPGHVPVVLRHRHAAARRAHRGRRRRRAGAPRRRRHLAELSVARRPAGEHRPARRAVHPRELHLRVSGAVPGETALGKLRFERRAS